MSADMKSNIKGISYKELKELTKGSGLNLRVETYPHLPDCVYCYIEENGKYLCCLSQQGKAYSKDDLDSVFFSYASFESEDSNDTRSLLGRIINSRISDSEKKAKLLTALSLPVSDKTDEIQRNVASLMALLSPRRRRAPMSLLPQHRPRPQRPHDLDALTVRLVEVGAFPYDIFPAIKKEMQPYEEILSKLLLTVKELPQGKLLSENTHKIKLYAAARPTFSVLNLYDRNTRDLIHAGVIVYPPYINRRREVAREEKSFFSDDAIIFSLAHELGHTQQILDGTDQKLEPKEKEVAADQFGALLTKQAGYSVYKAIKGLPVLVKEDESREHPPLSERQIKLIDFALQNNLFDEKEKQDAIVLRREIENFIKAKKKAAILSRREAVLPILADLIEKRRAARLARVINIHDSKYTK